MQKEADRREKIEAAAADAGEERKAVHCCRRVRYELSPPLAGSFCNAHRHIGSSAGTGQGRALRLRSLPFLSLLCCGSCCPSASVARH